MSADKHQGTILSQDQATQIAKEWISAWNHQDLDAIVNHFDKDAQFTSPFPSGMTGKRRLTGHDQLRDYFEKVLTKHPQIHLTLMDALPGKDSVAVYYKTVNDYQECEILFLGDDGKVKEAMTHFRSTNNSSDAADSICYAEASQMAHHWMTAWNQHDLNAILSHFEPQVEFTSPFVAAIAGDPSGTLHGTASLKQYFATALQNYPTLRFEFLDVLPGRDTVALYYRSVNNLLACEVMLLNEDGKVVKVWNHYRQAADEEVTAE